MARVRDALYSDLASRYAILKGTRAQDILTILMEKKVISAYQYRRNKRLDLTAAMKRKIKAKIWMDKILGSKK